MSGEGPPEIPPEHLAILRAEIARREALTPEEREAEELAARLTRRESWKATRGFPLWARMLAFVNPRRVNVGRSEVSIPIYEGNDSS